MSTPQIGIFTEGNRYHHVLEYTVPERSDLAAVRRAVRGAIAGIDETPVHAVVAFGPTLWSRLAPTAMPADFAPYATIAGPSAAAPSTQADIWIWMHGSARDEVMDAMMAADHALDAVAMRGLDQPGFTYHDSRDLTGFVDGSANPKEDARFDVALIGEGKPGAGGAFVVGQKWIHDLDAFNALPVADQEKVIGRTKADSIELEGDDLPDDSHVGRTDLTVDGVAMKMYRRSFPHGNARRKGLYFLAFACEQRRFTEVLNSMFGLTEDGIHDRLTDYSRAVTGSFLFAPSDDDLRAALV